MPSPYRLFDLVLVCSAASSIPSHTDLSAALFCYLFFRLEEWQLHTCVSVPAKMEHMQKKWGTRGHGFWLLPSTCKVCSAGRCALQVAAPSIRAASRLGYRQPEC